MPGISHAFFTRQGGVSTGLYAGLNTGTGSQDHRESVLENRARAAAYLRVSPDRLVTPYQVHGDTALVVTEPWAPGMGPKGGRLVTACPGFGQSGSARRLRAGALRRCYSTRCRRVRMRGGRARWRHPE
jgi:hypothetical protein